jgi:hypothetical protein
MLESCDNHARSEERNGEMFRCHAECRPVLETRQKAAKKSHVENLPLAMVRVSTLSRRLNIGQKDVWVNYTDLETMGSIPYPGKAVDKGPFSTHPALGSPLAA